MKPSKIALGLFSASIALCTTTAMAKSSWYPLGSINAHQQQQNHRINQGVQNGQLSASEYIRLQKGQYHVQRLETKARADQKVTPYERARILRAQAIQSQRIYRLKHN